MLRRALFVVLLAAAGGSSLAQDYQARIVPFAGGLSPWGGASSPISIDQFIGAQWNQSTPPINLSLKACADVPIIGNRCVGYGADGRASTSGKLGFQFGLHADGGNVQLGLPMTVGLNVNPGIQGLSPTTFSLPSSPAALSANGFGYIGKQGPLNVGAPFVRSTAPVFDASLSAILDLAFSASGNICYIYCLSGAVDAHPQQTVNLFNFGRNAQGGYDASVLGNGVALPAEIPLGTNVATLGVNVPDVSTDSNVRGGFDVASGTVRSMADDWLVGLKLDLAALAGKIFPILDPFLGSHDLGSIGGYDLLSASVGLFLRYVEEFTARIADVAVGFVFSDPVSFGGAAPSVTAVLHPGEDASVVAGSLPFGSLGVWPVYFTQAVVHHQPSLVPSLEGEVKVLDFDLAGHDFGPVAQAGFSLDLAKFELPAFDIYTDYIPIVGTPFNIYPAPDPANATQCIAAGCSHNEFRTTRAGCAIGTVDLGNCDPAVRPDQVWLVNGSCPQSVAASVCPGGLFLGETSTSAFTDSNHDDLLFTNAANFNFPAGHQGPVLGDTYAADWLSAGGFTGQAPAFAGFPPFEFPFVITAGVPEPGTLALLIAGLLLLAGRRSAVAHGDCVV